MSETPVDGAGEERVETIHDALAAGSPPNRRLYELESEMSNTGECFIARAAERWNQSCER